MVSEVRVTAGRAVLVVAFATIGFLGAVSLATAHPYLNSSEPGCDGSDPNVVLCDDFERGSWATSFDDDQAPANAGWYLSPIGSNGSLPYVICGTGSRDGGQATGPGAVGTNCTAYTISTFNDTNGGNAIRGEHGYGPNPDLSGTVGASTYNELYFRFYVKTSTGFQWPFAAGQKIISHGIANVGAGGIDIAGAPTRNSTFEACPIYDCGTLNFANPQNTKPGCLAGAYLCQNVGTLFDLAGLQNHWIFIEGHIKLNTFTGTTPNQDGIWEMWLSDCGVNGLGCTGTPTLRARFTNVRWVNNNNQLGKFFFDFWGNPAVGGTFYWDQLKVSRVGPIGFMGGNTTPPAAPSNLTVR
jgi:hypothetical protein